MNLDTLRIAVAPVAALSLLAACASSTPKSDTAPSPPGAKVISASPEVTQTPNEPIEKYLASRSAGVNIGGLCAG
jgi:hypothetical protein